MTSANLGESAKHRSVLTTCTDMSLSEGSYDDTMCYPVTKYVHICPQQMAPLILCNFLTLPAAFKRSIATFLDRPDVRKTIGVDPKLGKFSGCDYDVISRFHDSLDWIFPAHEYIAALLERGIRTLIYVGANDWICNWVRGWPTLACGHQF